MANYEDIVKANESIKTTNIKGKEYAEVNQRIKAFRTVYPEGKIMTSLISCSDGVCVFKASVYGNDNTPLGTGHAYEKESSSFINKTSYIENCETSAVGRALGMCGFGIDTSVCSAEELTNAINNQKSPQWEAKKDEVLKAANQKNITYEDLMKRAKVDSIEQLSIERLDNCLAYLAGL